MLKWFASILKKAKDLHVMNLLFHYYKCVCMMSIIIIIHVGKFI